MPEHRKSLALSMSPLVYHVSRCKKVFFKKSGMAVSRIWDVTMTIVSVVCSTARTEDMIHWGQQQEVCHEFLLMDPLIQQMLSETNMTKGLAMYCG